jgi:hypothetical protein
LIKGGLVVLAPGGGAVRRSALQYNLDTLTRSYQVQGRGRRRRRRARATVSAEGPTIESIKLEVEIDGTDSLELDGLA